MGMFLGIIKNNGHNKVDKDQIYKSDSVNFVDCQ